MSVGGIANAINLLTSPEWQLPIKLGDSREQVQMVLGAPSRSIPGSPDERYESYPDSGLNVEYDDFGRVSQVNIFRIGPLSYESPIFRGIRITDKMSQVWSSPDSVDSFGLGNQATSACFSS